eukprot:CAMPEP_0194776678 /NCGR_PEP_ID=MMETSP0323_2-20130528/63721_1 /TAXON_ID=2866 ORGANISM="Crypthecodinium cohnii, Strain Seligo" /NCGR_SAMPLE_ID=MMETSP0323_2 /ASSEMBLY_ACC=CAM_ASM_000346 /LENGTH=138 /DNA_ID=CAMNT_0039713189 /DNA_START=211 /DNA_END=621 /DNA_ORIENTATION=+
MSVSVKGAAKRLPPPTTVESSQAAAWVFGFRLLEASSLRCDDHLKTDEKSTEKEQSREDFGVSSGSVAGTAAAAAAADAGAVVTAAIATVSAAAAAATTGAVTVAIDVEVRVSTGADFMIARTVDFYGVGLRGVVFWR